MALLFMDGFEYADAYLAKKWDYQSSGSVGTAQARTGTSSMDGGILGKVVAASGDTAILGFGVYYGGGAWHVGVDIPGWTSLCCVSGETDGTLNVRQGSHIGTILGTTGPGTVRLDAWNYIEVKFFLSDTVGTAVVKLNSATVITVPATDLCLGTYSTWTSVEFTVGSYNFFDDIYVCDGSGGINDDFLGECRVVTLLPQTDAVAAGSNASFTCSGGTDHGALVDEASPDDDTSYLSSSTLNHVDSWQYPALGYTGTIKGVQMSLAARKSDSGTRAIAAVTRPVATNRVHATNHYIGTSYVYWMSIWETNPEDSGAWEVADVDGAEFGVKVTV